MRNNVVAPFASLTQWVRFLVVAFTMSLAAGCGTDPVSDTTTATTAESLKCTTNADCGEGGLCIVDSGLCRGPQGEPGKNGVSCTVNQTSMGAAITCTDGTSATVNNGTDGTNGLDGLDGSSCSGFDNGDGTKVVKCTDGTSFTLKDGADGTTVIIINEVVDPAPECYNDSDCPFDYGYCLGASSYMDDYSCISGRCQVNTYIDGQCALPPPPCVIDADCGAGSQWCEKDSIYQTKVSCISGACVPKDYFIEACDYGCTDGTGCHSAPGSVCPVGAECDDGDPTTKYDKCNEAGVCAGHYEAPPEADCHLNPGGAGFVFKGSGPTQLRVVWTFNPGGQVDPEFSEIVLASPGQEFWNTTATGVYMRPTDSADPNWWNKGHDQKVQECKLLVTCLNVCHEQFISAPTQYDADCECPFDGGLGPS